MESKVTLVYHKAGNNVGLEGDVPLGLYKMVEGLQPPSSL
jgi:hypothetical protein